MSEAVQCPKCKSTQVSAQKNSNRIDVYCLACGTKWNPVKRASQEKQDLAIKKATRQSRWKKKFYEAYESRDEERATYIAKREFPLLMRNNDLGEVYEQLKRQDKVATIVQAAFMVLIVVFFLWLAAK